MDAKIAVSLVTTNLNSAFFYLYILTMLNGNLLKDLIKHIKPLVIITYYLLKFPTYSIYKR